MRLVRIIGVALVAVFAFSAMAATGASAHEFESSVTGLLLASADGPQLFTTLAGHLLCNTLLGHGFVLSTKTLLQLATVAYHGCTVSIGALTTKPDEPIVATYLFSADLLVTIEKDVTILASLAGLKCTITVKAQGPLLAVEYDNISENKEILLLSHVHSIVSSATGGGCAKQYTNLGGGLYLGNAFVKVHGGTVKWV